MNCKKAQQELLSFRDGELPSRLQKRVSRHLETCAECASFMAALPLINDSEEISIPPSGFAWTRLNARLSHAHAPGLLSSFGNRIKGVAFPAVFMTAGIVSGVAFALSSYQHSAEKNLATELLDDIYLDEFSDLPDASPGSLVMTLTDGEANQ